MHLLFAQKGIKKNTQLRFKIKRTSERPGKHYIIVPEGLPGIENQGCYVTTIYGIEPTKENCEKIRKAINKAFETKGA
jgi:translation initiation factor 1 (eIF-1/SUI1)